MAEMQAKKKGKHTAVVPTAEFQEKLSVSNDNAKEGYEKARKAHQAKLDAGNGFGRGAHAAAKEANTKKSTKSGE